MLRIMAALACQDPPESHPPHPPPPTGLIALLPPNRCPSAQLSGNFSFLHLLMERCLEKQTQGLRYSGKLPAHCSRTSNKSRRGGEGGDHMVPHPPVLNHCFMSPILLRNFPEMIQHGHCRLSCTHRRMSFPQSSGGYRLVTTSKDSIRIPLPPGSPP